MASAGASVGSGGGGAPPALITALTEIVTKPPTAITQPLPSQLLAPINQAINTSADAIELVFNTRVQNQSAVDVLLRRIIAVLNDGGENAPSVNTKIAHLSVLTGLARTANPAFRERLFTAFTGVNSGFERHLLEREEGHKQYGTALGPLHELTLVFLLRCGDGAFSANSLLEWCTNDIRLALQLLTSIVGVKLYEHAVVSETMRVLREFTASTTYLDIGDADGTSAVVACRRLSSLGVRLTFGRAVLMW